MSRLQRFKKLMWLGMLAGAVARKNKLRVDPTAQKLARILQVSDPNRLEFPLRVSEFFIGEKSFWTRGVAMRTRLYAVMDTPAGQRLECVRELVSMTPSVLHYAPENVMEQDFVDTIYTGLLTA